MIKNVWLWRHPRPTGHEGRCIGRTDVPVDPRKARRLARRIHAQALRRGLPRIVHTSPLTRAHAVGRCLRSLGWRHVIDVRLIEVDFGVWEGRLWQEIPAAEVDAWVADFADHAPGGGERLRQTLQRVAQWQAPCDGITVVGHAGWMLARRWLVEHGSEQGDVRMPQASEWPAPPAYGACWVVSGTSLACSSP